MDHDHSRRVMPAGAFLPCQTLGQPKYFCTGHRRHVSDHCSRICHRSGGQPFIWLAGVGLQHRTGQSFGANLSALLLLLVLPVLHLVFVRPCRPKTSGKNPCSRRPSAYRPIKKEGGLPLFFLFQERPCPLPSVKYKISTITAGARNRIKKDQERLKRNRLSSASISLSAFFVPQTQPTNRQNPNALSGIIKLSVNFSSTAFMGSICTPEAKSNHGRFKLRSADWLRE